MTLFQATQRLHHHLIEEFMEYARQLECLVKFAHLEDHADGQDREDQVIIDFEISLFKKSI